MLDEEGARVAGVPVGAAERRRSPRSPALTVALSMRIVGILLIAALMVLPVTAATRIAWSLRSTLLLSIAIGLGSVLVGLTIAYYADLPPGGTIVLVAAGVLPRRERGRRATSQDSGRALRRFANPGRAGGVMRLGCARFFSLSGCLALLLAASAQADQLDRTTGRSAVTKSTHPARRYGTSRLWVILPTAGVLRVQGNQPDDGCYGTKLGWIPDRDRSLQLVVSGRRLDAPGRMRVLGVNWGYSSTGKGSPASAVGFPKAGCWRITGRAGATTVSYVVRVVTES